MLKAILIDSIKPDLSKEEAVSRLIEAENLIKTFGGITLVKKIQRKLVPNYKTYLGKGKIQEIIEENQDLNANILIINNELKPQQNYNIGKMVSPAGLQVWDRIDLILKIFQKHANTKEAKLEIELASIRHMGPRIFGMGMELSQQAGGIGTRGIGETNIEFMRRHLKKFEDRIKKQLESCRKVRKLHRKGRKRKNLKTVGIIGYTNAGKTSLLNALTKKGAQTADKLFTTLDTRVGKLYFEKTGKEVLVSDTIGFIQNLPTTLIKSFESTLEETIEADLLLHVIDINDQKLFDKIKTVNLILAKIDSLVKPTIYVFNKIDCYPDRNFKILSTKFRNFNPQFISSITGEEIDSLKKAIESSLQNISKLQTAKAVEMQSLASKS